jgi:hypothetical protein
MANVKISDMTPGSALAGTELLEMVQSAGTYSTTPSAIKTYILSAPVDWIGGTVTVSNPVIDATQTWNDGAVTFTGLKLNVTSTASAAASMLIDLQVAGVSQFNVTKGGAITATGVATVLSAVLAAAGTLSWTGRSILSSGADGALTLTNAGATNTVTLTVGANNTLSSNGPIKASGGYTVAGLPAAGVAGRRAYVTDSNTAYTAGIGAIVAAGGANVVPVFDDGTNWRIG